MDKPHFHKVNTTSKNRWKRLLSFLGPAYLVSVGYMDPGNWATDIAAGSKYGYALIWVIVLSNITAILVQSHSARLGIVTGKDIAQFSRGYYPRFLNFIYWIFAEIAIAATDLAEILGMAIGLKLLFNLNMLIGVSLTLFDTLIIMYLVKKGVRTMEAIIIGLISIIGISFSIELFLSKPNVPDVFMGVIPDLPDSGALYIAIGIIGATVMPHNLYLHSALVQTRDFKDNVAGKKRAIKFNFIDTSIALNMALFVNAAILILAGSAFYGTGHYGVEDIMDAYKMLAPILGTVLAPILFAVALIASGQSSTLTGTLTGQIIMEGYLNIRLAPWLRRLITRLLAVIPAFLTIMIAGEKMATELLIFSQVLLSLQLGFAVIPLLHWVSSKKVMGEFSIGTITKIFSWLVISVIVYLNLRMVFEFMINWTSDTSLKWIIYLLVFIPVGGAIILLLYTIFEPMISRFYSKEVLSPHHITGQISIKAPASFKKVGIAVDFSSSDIKAINYAMKISGPETEYVLIHIVESAGARVLNKEVYDNETQRDRDALMAYAEQLEQQNIKASHYIGFGLAPSALPKAVKELGLEMLILGSHKKGYLHRLFKGTTINKVQLKVDIPVFIVK